jgi:F420-dependent oxidoreductase-like protein
MRIGLSAGDGMGRGAPEQIRQDLAEAVEDGLATFVLPNIFGADALTMLAVLGQQAPDIRLGVGVVPIYLHHPMALAQQAMTVQWATGGRLLLGVGLSHQIVVEAMLGLSYAKPAAYMEEYLTVLTSLVRTGAVAHTGERITANGGYNVAGYEPFPVVVAALGPRMLEIAGRIGDGTSTWMCGLDTIRSHIAPSIVAAAEAAGRDRAPEVQVALPVCVTDDEAGARAKAGMVFAMYGSLPSYRAMLDREGAAGPADVALVGSEEQVRDMLDQFAEAGTTEFVAVNYSDDPDEHERTRAVLRSAVAS